MYEQIEAFEALYQAYEQGTSLSLVDEKKVNQVRQEYIKAGVLTEKEQYA